MWVGAGAGRAGAGRSAARRAVVGRGGWSGCAAAGQSAGAGVGASVGQCASVHVAHALLRCAALPTVHAIVKSCVFHAVYDGARRFRVARRIACFVCAAAGRATAMFTACFTAV